MTEIDPRQTAADLRNAALVSAAAGHNRLSLIDTLTGQLCAMGALRVAVGQEQIIALAQPDLFGYPLVFRLRPAPMGKAQAPRVSAAADALAPQLPEPCSDCQKDYVGHEGDVRLIHYSDHVCTGGEELALLFVQAAEKIEADLP